MEGNAAEGAVSVANGEHRATSELEKWDQHCSRATCILNVAEDRRWTRRCCTVVFSGKGYVGSRFEFQNRKGEGEVGAADRNGGGSSFKGCDGSDVAGELGWLGRSRRRRHVEKMKLGTNNFPDQRWQRLKDENMAQKCLMIASMKGRKLEERVQKRHMCLNSEK
ncbi:hypothetical protein V8G54_029145 [Vigna mungo]|uniref:Uncharacterized protein n=1 Tax=Vigna mungo TaxID=3915 RepID=A0AAQ3MUA6_VIGMU